MELVSLFLGYSYPQAQQSMKSQEVLKRRCGYKFQTITHHWPSVRTAINQNNSTSAVWRGGSMPAGKAAEASRLLIVFI
jgi:hypothetical protein